MNAYPWVYIEWYLADSQKKENVFLFAMNSIGIRYAKAHAHTKGVCSVLSCSFVYVHTYIGYSSVQ